MVKNKIIIILLIFLIPFISLNRLSAQNLNLDWVAHISGSGGTILTSSSAIDKSDNVFAVGAFMDSIEVITIDNGPVKLRSKGGYDMFVIKINPFGAIVWIKAVGGKGSLGHNGGSDLAMNHWFTIKLDQDANLYITGNYRDTVDFDPGAGQALKTTNSYFSGVVAGTPKLIFQEHSFILKLNKNGEFVWVRTLFGAINSSSGIALDYNESTLCITGYFSDTISMADGKKVHTLNTPGKGLRNVFIIKYDTSGRFIWAKQMGNKGSKNEGLDIDIDKKGYIYTSGTFYDSADFDPGLGTAYLLSTARPADNVFVSKLDSKGDYVWAKAMGSVSTSSIGQGAKSGGITVDDDGNVYTTGYFQVLGNFDPKGDPQHNISATGHITYFLSKLDSNGIYVWANTFDRPLNGKPGPDFGLGVQVNERGEVFTTGYFYGDIYFDSDRTNLSREVFQSGLSAPDAFIVKVNENGSFAWGRVLKSNKNISTSNNRGLDIMRSESNNIYVSGYFRGEVDFNSPGTPHSLRSLSQSNVDGFVLKLSCNDTSSSELLVELCGDKFEFLGKTFTEDGDFTLKTLGKSGCDSTIYLNLTLNEVPKPEINVNGFILGTVESYATYQWLYDDQLIQGATSRYHTVTQNGNYRVIVTTDKACMDTSKIYTVTNVTGIPDRFSIANEIKIYPNPSQDLINISAPIDLQIQLSGIDGRVLLQKRNVKTISLRSFSSGVYFLRLKDMEGNLIKVEKIIKE